MQLAAEVHRWRVHLGGEKGRQVGDGILSQLDTEVTVDGNYGFDRFFGALRLAVGSKNPPQERVAVVVRSICDLRRGSFPDDESWECFQSLLAENAKRATRSDERTTAASTSELSDEEATKWLQRALGLFAELAEAYGRQNP